MNIEDLAHPSWEAHGWERTQVQVCLNTFGEMTPADGLTHPDAPGLALVGHDHHGRKSVTLTHVGTGMNVGLLYYVQECPACPVALCDAARRACGVLDFVNLTLAEARAVPAAAQECARVPFRNLDEHECEACAWWHAARFPARIAELENEIPDLEDAVRSAEDALAEAEEDLHDAINELNDLKKRLKENS